MPIAILLATQRSGTNLFRGILGGHPQVDALPEIFAGDRSQAETVLDYRHGIKPFWAFFRERLDADKEVAFPDNRAELVREYIESIERVAEAENRTILLDVKYNSLHHMEGLFSGPTPIPKMLRYFMDHEIPIIHLTRDNVVRTVVSLLHAQATSQYVAKGDVPVEHKMISPDPDRFFSHVRTKDRNRQTVSRWLKPYGSCLELRYEDIFTDESMNELSSRVFEQAAKLLKLEGEVPLKAMTRKITSRDLRSVLGNFDAIQKRLAGSEFECYLDD